MSADVLPKLARLRRSYQIGDLRDVLAHFCASVGALKWSASVNGVLEMFSARFGGRAAADFAGMCALAFDADGEEEGLIANLTDFEGDGDRLCAIVAAELLQEPPELGELSRWVGDPLDQASFDSAMYCHFALEKWRATCRYGAIADDPDALPTLIRLRPEAELSALIVAWDRWEGPSEPVGFALLHRTWTGSLCLEYLAAHPAKLRTTAGVGIGLLHRVAVLARDIGAPSLWLETSKESAPFYQKVFGLNGVSDVLVVAAEQLAKFRSQLDAQWQVLREADGLTSFPEDPA